MLIYSIFLIIVIIILLFSSKTFSPIPYFPSQPVDISLIIKALNLRKNQTIIDLGAGDGIVIFRAATQAQSKKINTRFIAVEINPILILILHLRRLFHPNRKNIKVVYGNMFKIDFTDFIDITDFITIYLYISPWYLEKTLKNLKSQISRFSVVSYMYPINSLKKRESRIRGKNNVYTY